MSFKLYLNKRCKLLSLEAVRFNAIATSKGVFCCTYSSKALDDIDVLRSNPALFKTALIVFGDTLANVAIYL